MRQYACIHYENVLTSDQLYMHRTCSLRLKQFKIMMIDGVCRSERTGNGQLCMCGRNLCNSAQTVSTQTPITLVISVVVALLSVCSGTGLVCS